MDINDIIGKKWNKILVLNFLRIEDSKRKWRKNYYYQCKCDCGKIIELTREIILQEKRISCGCYKNQYGNITDQRLKEKHPNWNGYEEITGAFWAHIKIGAKKRNLEFNITIQDAWQQYLKQNKKCNLTEIELNLEHHWKTKSAVTASLDRIDSSKGYIKDNIQWVHKDVNLLKGSMSLNQLAYWCDCVVKNNEVKTL